MIDKALLTLIFGQRKTLMTSTLIILQARTSSSRLPGKVLMPILGQPMLSHQIHRLKQVKTPNKLIVATSILASDNAIAALCKDLQVECFRGSLNDVLERYAQAAKANNPAGEITNIVRVTGDCPLIDSSIIDDVIKLFVKDNVDYCSNCFPATLPDGLDVEVFSLDALEKAQTLCESKADREHVTPFIWRNPEIFSQSNFNYTSDLSHYRWTVDEPEDFELVDKIYQALFPSNQNFSLPDILSLLEQQPKLSHINHKFALNSSLVSASPKAE